MKDNDAAGQSPADMAETIVALGASAGGLEALDRFFAALDPQLPAGFVVIQHLAPAHKTMMDSLLARHTRMQVRVAKEGERVLAGHVYVIPSGVTMTLLDRRLHLVPRPEQGVMHPINSFFHSLAHSGCDQIIGIVLSGTGSDGSEGVQSIAEAGGWVLAQDQASAGFDGMPLNALATGVVHHQGPPEDLARFVEGVVREGRRPALLTLDEAPGLSIDETLAKVGAQVGIDLANYKPHTMIRRLERRVLATGQADIRAYLDRLADNPDEVALLRRELMIPVTAFFRDRDAFDMLAQKVIAPLLVERAAEAQLQVRAWSVGCATGQEAYSLAILILEAMREQGVEGELKLFASDIEQSYLNVAAAGRYPARLLQNIPEDIRARYFTEVEDGFWQVTPRLRRAIVFSQHDVLNDPPFLHLDLVVCRNMIIYLHGAPQERAIRRMLFGLSPGGALFLGGSEAPGKLAPLLDTICARSKIYRIRGQLRHLASDDILSMPNRVAAGGARLRAPVAPLALGEAVQLPGSAAASLIGAYVPPSVVIDGNRHIRHVIGDVFPYLKLRSGDASLDLVQLLPEPLAAVVSTLIFSALRGRGEPKSVVLHPADETGLAGDRPVRIVLRPVPSGALRSRPEGGAHQGDEAGQQLIVSFEALPAPGADTAPLHPAPLHDAHDSEGLAALSAHRANELESELEQVRATLKVTIEELGSANEELQASNEELMAANEELQSTNEELQSVNEELHTVNAELQEKILQLNEAYADLEGLSQAARIPLVFLDHEGRITRFSGQATQIFRLREPDIGRPLMDITHVLDMPDLEDRIREAMQNQATRQREVLSRDGRSWLVTIQPFVGRSHQQSRIVLSFVDISSVQTMRHLQAVIDAAPQNLAVLDRQGNIRMVNAAWNRFARDNGGTKALAKGQEVNYLEALRGAAAQDDDARHALAGLEAVLDAKRDRFSFIYPCHAPDRQRWFMMHASPLAQGGCVVTHLDITDLRLRGGQSPETEVRPQGQRGGVS